MENGEHRIVEFIRCLINSTRCFNPALRVQNEAALQHNFIDKCRHVPVSPDPPCHTAPALVQTNPIMPSSASAETSSPSDDLASAFRSMPDNPLAAYTPWRFVSMNSSLGCSCRVEAPSSSLDEKAGTLAPPGIDLGFHSNPNLPSPG